MPSIAPPTTAPDQEPSVTSPRPIEDVSVPAETARKKLQEKLREQFEFDDESAEKLSRASADPAAFRRALDSPLRQPVPGGWITYAITDLFTPAVSINPANPRETERRVFPAAAKPGETVTAPLSVANDPTRRPSLVITGDTPQHVANVVERSANWLRDMNPELGLEIASDRVLEPVMVAMTQIRHRDGSDPVHVPVAVDGSTRTAHCHHLTGVTSPDVVYRWTRATYREWKGLLSMRAGAQDRAASEVTPEAAAAHRALVFQAKVILRVEPVRGGEPVGMVGAVRALVAGIHVSPPKAWSQGSQLDEIADAVLDRLVLDRRISSELRDYLAGMVDPSSLRGRDAGFADTRAAQIASVIFDARNGTSISAAYRFLRDKRKLGKEDKPELAAELMMRSFRTDHPAPALKALRPALQRTINLPELRSVNWQVRPERSLDELLEAALTELHRDGDVLKADRLELAVRATYWLVNHRALAIHTREVERVLRDTRAPSGVIRAMLQSEHGLRQMHRAILDGRQHPKPQSISPLSEVDGQGVPELRAGGGHKPLNDFRLREMFPPGAAAGTDTQSGTVTPQPDADTPEARLQRLLRRTAEHADRLEGDVAEMERVAENGISLVRTQGLPPGHAEAIAGKLTAVADRLKVWAYTARVSAAPTPVLTDEDLFGSADTPDVEASL